MVRVRTYARTLGPTLPKIMGKRRAGPFHTDREIENLTLVLGMMAFTRSLVKRVKAIN